MKGWAGAFFDLDGTLADTVELILSSYRHTMRVHRGAALPDDLWLSGLGKPLTVQLGEFASSAAEVDAMRETFRAYQRRVHDDMIAPYEGALALLQELTEAGRPVAVVTSKSREMALRTLERCGFTEHVDCLVTADDVTNGKPDPEPVERALDLLHLARERTRVIFVGDSPWDVRAGKAAGVRTAGVLWGPFSRTVIEREKPDHLVERFDLLFSLSP